MSHTVTESMLDEWREERGHELLPSPPDFINHLKIARQPCVEFPDGSILLYMDGQQHGPFDSADDVEEFIDNYNQGGS